MASEPLLRTAHGGLSGVAREAMAGVRGSKLTSFATRTSILATVFIATGPNAAEAWPEAPLCALREPALETDAPMSMAGGPGYGGMGRGFPNGGPPAMNGERIPWTAPVTLTDSRRAFRKAARLEKEGQLDDALLQLRVAGHTMPTIADRFALKRGELLMALGQADNACHAFSVAEDSPHRSVSLRAHVGLVHCALERDDRTAERSLAQLLQRYPLVSNLAELRMAQAQYRERRKNRWGAAAIYRKISVEMPGSSQAEAARLALERLSAAGVRVAALSPAEQVQRAEALMKRGPVSQARLALAELIANRKLPSPQKAQAYVLAAKMARTEGRWEDAKSAVRRATSLGAGTDAMRYLPPSGSSEDQAKLEAAQKSARARIKSIRRWRYLPRVPQMQLASMLRIAVRHGLQDEANELVEAIAKSRKASPTTRFNAAISAVGLVEDRLIAQVLEPVLKVHRFRLSGRYYHARALERMGNLDEAKAAYEYVAEHDRSSTPYYGMWAKQRLSRIALGADLACPARAKGTEAEAKKAEASAVGPAVTSACGGQEGLLRDPLGETRATRLSPSARRKLLAKLAPIADRYAEPYPWFARAAALVRLGDERGATDELNEAYLAYRDALGTMRFRSGLETVYSGRVPARRGGGWPLLRERRSLTRTDRQVLAEVARQLGDAGTALRFGQWDPNQRPRAFPNAVLKAAEEHGVDPNLLYAVMRVESIYNPRIISHVGAVGLMQIMPRTGRLIASSLGEVDFEVSDLLEPETNIRFAAWYLASLIRRFDGRLPLAIASYNGGPHNVRLWLQSWPKNMPMDAFLEHIPFGQTHRYVRRVLTHFAAYRAQRELPMPLLQDQLPDPGPDEVAF